MERKYNLCDKVLETFPALKMCERPTRKGTRCELHPIKRIWPGDDEEHDTAQPRQPDSVKNTPSDGWGRLQP